MIDVTAIERRYAAVLPHLDERGRRLVAASEALVLGHGGVNAVSLATGVARSPLGRGLKELRGEVSVPAGRVRRVGGGRQALAEKDPGLAPDLERLVEPSTRGDPERALLWTCKSLRKLAGELRGLGHQVSHQVVGERLGSLGYSLQANRKVKEGAENPDRDAQFHHINASVARFQAAGQPVISVDTKKKERVGDFKNAGRAWRPRGSPEPVRGHDFLLKELGRAVPYGVYDLTGNRGWVSVGTSCDTAEFAVQTIRRWWRSWGSKRYPGASRLLINADGGGSNGSRVRLWKRELQRLANETGLEIAVCRLAPASGTRSSTDCSPTSARIGGPGLSYRTIVNTIAATTTQGGLKVDCELDTATYSKGIKVSDQEMAALKITRDPFHGEWNYTISPQNDAIIS